MNGELLSNNWSYCLSKHMLYENNLELDERLCFILSSSLGLQLKPLKPNLFHKMEETSVLQTYIDPINNFSVESFANNFCCEVGHLHDYSGGPEIEWIVKGLIEKGKTFFVTLSNQILFSHTNSKNENKHIPIYAILKLSSEFSIADFNISNINNVLLDLEFANSKSITVSVADFLNFWIIENDLLNANSFEYVLGIMDNVDNHLSFLVFNALIRQYHALQLNDKNCNIRLLENLRLNIAKSNSETERLEHQEMLASSFNHKNNMGEQAMYRDYFAYCLSYLEELGLLDTKKLSSFYREAGMAWKETYELINSKNYVVGKREFLDTYTNLIEKEKLALNSLKNTIAL